MKWSIMDIFIIMKMYQHVDESIYVVFDGTWGFKLITIIQLDKNFHYFVYIHPNPYIWCQFSHEILHKRGLTVSVLPELAAYRPKPLRCNGIV